MRHGCRDGLLRQLDPDLMQGGMGGRLGYIVAFPDVTTDRVSQPPSSNTILVEWSQQAISNTGPDMGCGIREVRRVPVELRGARGPVPVSYTHLTLPTILRV